MIASSELTYTGLVVAVFANQICLPVPAVVLLMAAGALSARGEMQTDIIVLLSVLGCLAADGLWFWFGRRCGSKALRLLCALTADPRKSFLNAQDSFRRHGLRLLLVSKFVPGLDGIVPPLGGAQGVSLTGFLAFDAIGSFLWSGFYVGLGYFFSSTLMSGIVWAQQFGTALGIAIGAAIGLYIGWRGLGIVRMVHRLRQRRITPPQLERKLKSDRKVAVLDLLAFEEEDDQKTVEAIPGAFIVDPSRLQNSPQIDVPDDVEIILYCSSGRDIVSARAAMALKQIGIDKVLVLEGGLNAWREHGFPTSRALEAPEVVAERLGVELPRQ
jgi:membrane protein DedA with SNARE-associated domain/rhodanese-related sulfurtransferase